MSKWISLFYAAEGSAVSTKPEDITTSDTYDHSTTPIHAQRALTLSDKNKKQKLEYLAEYWLTELIYLPREGKLAVDAFLKNQTEAYWYKTGNSIKEIGSLVNSLKSEENEGERELLQRKINIVISDIKRYASIAKNYETATHYFVREIM